MIWLGLDCAAVAPFLAASPGKNGAWAQKENILPQYHLWQCLFYLNWIDEAEANVEETHGGHHHQGSMFHLSFFEEDDDDCWRLMMTRTTLHFWCLTHENQTGRKRSDWHTKISASERVTLTGAARLRTLVFWELRKVLITLKYISCFVTSWAFHLSSLQVVARPLFCFFGVRTMGARISNSLLWQRCCVCCNTLTIS